MDKVRSALKIFGGPYILGSKTTAFSHLESAKSLRMNLAYLYMNVVILLNWACKCGS